MRTQGFASVGRIGIFTLRGICSHWKGLMQTIILLIWRPLWQEEGGRRARTVCSQDALRVHTQVRALWTSVAEVSSSRCILEIYVEVGLDPGPIRKETGKQQLLSLDIFLRCFFFSTIQEELSTREPIYASQSSQKWSGLGIKNESHWLMIN